MISVLSTLTESATYREIHQQPEVWSRTAESLGLNLADIRGFLDPILADPRARIILTGAGTSAFAGQLLAPALSTLLDRRVEAIATTDIVSNPRDAFVPDVPTVLVSFARSGNSPESVAATDLADALVTDSYHLIITCAADGQLATDRGGDANSLVILTPPEANDKGFAMTSSFTSMSLSCLLAFGATVPTESLVAAAQWVLDNQGRILKLAGTGFERIVYLGSGALTGVARESALKMLELTAGGVVAYYDSPLGFRHGPKSILNDKTLVVVYLSGDPYTRKYDVDIVTELRQNIGEDRVVVLSTEVQGETPASDWIIPGDLSGDAPSALAYVVFAQLLALFSSDARGLPVDNPFPGGEVNRVVQGVKIHPLS